MKDVARHQVAQHSLSDVLVGTRLRCQVRVTDVTINRHERRHIIVRDPAKSIGDVVLGRTSVSGVCVSDRAGGWAY